MVVSEELVLQNLIETPCIPMDSDLMGPIDFNMSSSEIQLKLKPIVVSATESSSSNFS